MDLFRPDILKSLTSDERSKIDRFRKRSSSALIDQAIKERGDHPPLALYHYTNGTGLLGIIDDVQLRASHIGYLNDRSELRHILALLERGAAKHRESNADANLREFLVGLETVLRQRIEDVAQTPQVWVVCLCDAPDLLSQWRGYGGEHAGYAIGFDFVRLQSMIRPGWTLAPCVYSPEFQQTSADQLLAEIVEIYVEGRGRFSDASLAQFRDDLLNVAVSDISWLGALQKDAAFAEECEWRIYTRGPGDHVPSIKFLSRQSTISQYVNLPLSLDDKKQVLPLFEIIVGPSRNQDLSCASIRAMLEQRGYPNPQILPSAVPFRSL